MNSFFVPLCTVLHSLLHVHIVHDDVVRRSSYMKLYRQRSVPPCSLALLLLHTNELSRVLLLSDSRMTTTREHEVHQHVVYVHAHHRCLKKHNPGNKCKLIIENGIIILQ